MGKLVQSLVCVVAVLLWMPGKALPQEASSESIAAAKELMVTARLADQMKQMLPLLLQQLKPLVARGNPVVERDYDALVPTMVATANSHMDAFLEEGAKIYARHFTADEMRQVTAFYRSPIGEKFLRKQPEVMQESMTLGQKFGQIMAKDLQGRMTDELRKRGHNI